MEIATINGTDFETSIRTDVDISTFYGGLQINLPFKKSSESLKIEVEGFNDLKVLWLNKIYRGYEGQVWTRLFTNDERMKFHCLLCDKVLCRFSTLRNHLNMHLEIFPFKCYSCEKKYTSNTSLYNHRRKKHDNN